MLGTNGIISCGFIGFAIDFTWLYMICFTSNKTVKYNIYKGGILGKYDLCILTTAHSVEIANGNNTNHLVPEVFFFQFEHICSHFACIDLASTGCDHFEKFTNRRYIQFVHFLFHHPRYACLNKRNGAKEGRKGQSAGHSHSGVTYRGSLYLIHLFFGDGIKTKKGKEYFRFNAFHYG